MNGIMKINEKKKSSGRTHLVITERRDVLCVDIRAVTLFYSRYVVKKKIPKPRITFLVRSRFERSIDKISLPDALPSPPLSFPPACHRDLRRTSRRKFPKIRTIPI